MKNLKLLFAGLFLLFLSLATKSQSINSDYFAGTWSVLLRALPQGDTKMFIVLEKKDTTLAGIVQDSTAKEIAKIDKIELADTTITVYFTAQGYDVSLVMNKKDEDHITGSLMNMFEAEGERVKAK